MRKALAVSAQHDAFHSVLRALIRVSLRSSKSLRRVAQEAGATVAFAISDPETWRLGYLAKRLADAGVRTVGVKVRYLASSSSKQTEISGAEVEVKKFRWYSLRDIIFLHHVGMIFISQPYLTSGLLGSEGSPHSKKIYVPYTFGIVANGAETSFGSYIISKVDTVLVPLVEIEGKYKEELGIEEIVAGFPGVSEVRWKPMAALESDEVNILWAPHWTTTLGGKTGVFFDWFEMLCNLRSEIEASGKKCQIMFRPHPRLLANLKPRQRNSLERVLKSRTFLVSRGQGVAEDFNWSSVLIHNSGSFTIEYLLTGKPGIFLNLDSDVFSNLTPLGQKALRLNLVVDSFESMRTAVLDNLDGGGKNADRRLRYSINLRKACGGFEDRVISLALATLNPTSNP